MAEKRLRFEGEFPFSEVWGEIEYDMIHRKDNQPIAEKKEDKIQERLYTDKIKEDFLKRYRLSP